MVIRFTYWPNFNAEALLLSIETPMKHNIMAKFKHRLVLKITLIYDKKDNTLLQALTVCEKLL